jgi:hypothetical protein
VSQLSFETFDKKKHDRDGFDCGNDDLNRYLSRGVGQHQRKGISRTVCLVPAGPVEGGRKPILGYHSLCASSVTLESVPSVLAKRFPQGQSIPTVLLARLAIGLEHQRGGYGKLLMADVFERVAAVADTLGVAFLEVDAIDERAAEYYETIHGFKRAASRNDKLFLPIATIRKAIS